MPLDFLTNLYEKARPISDLSNFAGLWAQVLKTVGAENVKVINPQLIGKLKFPVEVGYLKKVMARAVFIFPIGFFHLSGFGFREVQGKKFSIYDSCPIQIYSSCKALMEGEKFKLNTPIVLSEGVKDAEVLSSFYPYSFAYLTSRISKNQAEFLKCFTDRVLVIPDNDEAGKKGLFGTKKALEDFGFSYEIYFPQIFKDPSEPLEMVLQGKRKEEAKKELQGIRKKIKNFVDF